MKEEIKSRLMYADIHEPELEVAIAEIEDLIATLKAEIKSKVEKYFIESIEIQNKCNPKNSLKIAMLEDDKREVLSIINQ